MGFQADNKIEILKLQQGEYNIITTTAELDSTRKNHKLHNIIWEMNTTGNGKEDGEREGGRRKEGRNEGPSRILVRVFPLILISWYPGIVESI